MTRWAHKRSVEPADAAGSGCRVREGCLDSPSRRSTPPRPGDGMKTGYSCIPGLFVPTASRCPAAGSLEVILIRHDPTVACRWKVLTLHRLGQRHPGVGVRGRGLILLELAYRVTADDFGW